MILRELKKEEKDYTYTSSPEVLQKTGCIGHLRGDFGSSGIEWYSNWFEHNPELKTQEFSKDIDKVINTQQATATTGRNCLLVCHNRKIIFNHLRGNGAVNTIIEERLEHRKAGNDQRCRNGSNQKAHILSSHHRAC